MTNTTTKTKIKCYICNTKFSKITECLCRDCKKIFFMENVSIANTRFKQFIISYTTNELIATTPTFFIEYKTIRDKFVNNDFVKGDFGSAEHYHLIAKYPSSIGKVYFMAKKCAVIIMLENEYQQIYGGIPYWKHY